MTKRKNIPNKTRFEVFKRDSFTCQYCGQCSPEVVLNLDHVTPVFNGGDNSITNLITACFDCNSGKGAEELNGDIETDKQKSDLQLKMMLEWKERIHKSKSKKIKAIGISKSYMGALYYIRGILRNRFSDVNEPRAIKLLEEVYLANASISSLKEASKTCSSWSAFQETVHKYLDESENMS